MESYRPDDIVVVKKYPDGIFRVVTQAGDHYTLVQCGINKLVKITTTATEMSIVRKSKNHKKPVPKKKEADIHPNLEF